MEGSSHVQEGNTDPWYDDENPEGKSNPLDDSMPSGSGN